MKRMKLSYWLAALLVVLAGCTQPSPRFDSSESASADVPASASKESMAPTAKASPAPSPRADSNARLGTRWGEGLRSEVTTVEATRINPNRPDGTGVVYYDRTDGRNTSNQVALLTMPLANGRLEFSILDADGNKMPLSQQRGGQLHLSGKDGERYQLSFTNLGVMPYEIVATVDGLDVVSGKPGKLSNDGYVLNPGDTLNIEGFRKNQQEVAAFRFSSVKEAYASNTPAGDPKNTGVIGAAVFALTMNDAPKTKPDRARPPRPNAFPGDPAASDASSYAPSPTYKN